ncbi:MAG: phage tail family protein [Clostridia bacterium]|jgi:predicted phage tail component-like protein|nr:phage tail family protein [Clostridia bacterium]MCI2014570.1 phage tail family protein [Clostridia bacterium]
MAVLSRIKGFSFNGAVVNNTLDNGVYLLDVNKDAVPELLYTSFNIPNRDGTLTISNRFENKNITVKIGVYAATVTERRSIERELIKNMVRTEGKLIFLDEPTFFYKAKIYGAIGRTEGDVFTEIQISFLCSPFMYELYDDLRDYTVNQLSGTTIESIEGLLINKSAWQNITDRTVKTVVNSGNYKAFPTIEIVGTASLLTIQINDVAFSLSDVDGTVYVNCEKMICYTQSGNTKTSFLQNFTGSFPFISTGENTVIIDGTSLDLTEITVEYPNTYIV